VKNNSKTKVEKVFFFIFMSSYAEIFFFLIGRYGVQKIKWFKMGLLIFVSSSVQKLEPKNSIF
jgi:hypothetical protein